MVKNVLTQKHFIHYTEITFLSKTQSSLTCAEYVFLFFKFYDVKTETSMSCKEPEAAIQRCS